MWNKCEKNKIIKHNPLVFGIKVVYNMVKQIEKGTIKRQWKMKKDLHMLQQLF